MELSSILKELLMFAVVAVLILSIAGIALTKYLGNFKFTSKKAKVYGVLYNLDNKSIWSISLVTLNFFFCTWCIMRTSSMNPIYLSVIFVSLITSSILVKDYVKVIMDLLTASISAFSIYLIDYVHVYLSGEVEDVWMRIAVFFMIAFAFLYFTYNYINNINSIVMKNKHIAKKKRGNI